MYSRPNADVMRYKWEIIDLSFRKRWLGGRWWRGKKNASIGIDCKRKEISAYIYIYRVFAGTDGGRWMKENNGTKVI